MNPLSSAPFLPVFAGWCATLSLSSRVPHPLAILAGVLLSTAFLLIGTRRIPPGFGLYLPLTLLLVALPAIFLLLRVQGVPPESKHYEGEATVVSERSWGFRRAVVLDTAEGRTLCLASPEKPLLEGTELRVKGMLVPLEQLFPNRGGSFNAPLFWRGKGVKQGFRPEGMANSGKPGSRLGSWRTFLRKRLLLCLPPLSRGHLLAAWTGERDPEVADLHRLWGTSHLLAVSGFHVGILAAVLLWCLHGFRFKLLWSSAILWSYVFLTGGAASACRAMTMIQLVLLGPIVAGRPSSPVNSVSVAGGLLLLANPWLFWDIGWRLSIISALVLCSSSRVLTGRNAVLTGFAIWLATAGEASRVFESVPVAGLFMNLLALPAFSILLPTASIAALPALAGIPGGGILALGMETVFESWTALANAVCVLLPWQIPYNPLIGSLSAGILGGAAGLGVGMGWKRAIVLAVLACFCRLLFS